ncbi:MAG TPA: ABC transporter permease [Sphingobacteriaceae bacterium]|nr:ABC transporter permease [Sphingobacteriaceae bacterium]
MNKILLIIQREYLSRVKKKSFLMVTFLVPLFLIGIYALMIFLTANSFRNNQATIHVVDQSGVFEGRLESTDRITYIMTHDDMEAEKSRLAETDESKQYLLIIPETLTDRFSVELLSPETPGMAVQNAVENHLEQALRDHRLEASGIDSATLSSIDPRISVAAKELTADGEKDSSTGATMGIAMFLSILIYMTLFIYGAQVMRGIIEEKQSRIVEVIISSVKPFQLMMGKIIGIGLVGLTQFILWILLSGGLMAIASNLFMDTEAVAEGMAAGAAYQEGTGGEIMGALDTIDLGAIAMWFLVYFLGGYLLYSALFAAVGSAVDNETETQQFMFPITMPLLLAYMLSFGVLINDPHGGVAFWLSMIPLTSPVAMLVRIPYGVPEWQILLSVALLIGGFIVATWFAARIYRVGILMYGKKVTYKELMKWFRYKG